MYIAFFNRAADKAGLEYWKTQAQSLGESEAMKVLAASFALHPKFSSLYDGLTNQEYVEAIYINTLGKAGDAEGIVYWTKLLNDGSSRSDMVAAFVNASLAFDSSDPKYSALHTDNTQGSSKSINVLDTAQQRQDLLKNKVAIALMFSTLLKEVTNLAISTNPSDTDSLNLDPAYRASVSILTEVTDDKGSREYIENLLTEIAASPSIAIAMINRLRVQYGSLVQNEETVSTIKSLIEGFKDFTYGTITSEITGRVWMDRNLGATAPCTSIDDTSCFGDYFQWGRYPDGHEKVESSISLKVQDTFNPNDGKFVVNSNDWSALDTKGTFREATWNVCPTGFRIPTLEEVQAENMSKNTDLFKLAFAGKRDDNGIVKDDSSLGFLHTTAATSLGLTKIAEFTSSFDTYSVSKRTVGAPIRCIQVLAPSAWEVSDWSACSGACGTKNGRQERTVTCKDKDGTVLNDSYCFEKKPESSQLCKIETPVPCASEDGISTCPIPSQTIVEGSIENLGGGNVSIDLWSIAHHGGQFSYNFLSELGSPWTDIDNDGIQLGVDTLTYFFEGNTDFNSYIVRADDFSPNGVGGEDGSTHPYDSYYNAGNLGAGNYLLSVSDYSYRSNEVPNGQQRDNRYGPYRITFEGDIEILNMPNNAKIVCQKNDPNQL